jgi:hypothetical protein
MTSTGDDRDLIEFTIKSNVVSSEAIRRFKRSLRIDEIKVSRNNSDIDSRESLTYGHRTYRCLESIGVNHRCSKSKHENSCTR